MLVKDANDKLEKIKKHLPLGDCAWWYQRGLLDGFVDYAAKFPSQNISNIEIPKAIENWIMNFVNSYKAMNIEL